MGSEQVTVSMEVSEKRLADLLVGALEGGSTYWIDRIEVHDGDGKGQPWGPTEYTPRYIRAPFSTGGKLILDPGEGDATATLDRRALSAGLQLLARAYPKHFSDFICGHDDADTADIYLQLCCFGEVRYTVKEDT